MNNEKVQSRQGLHTWRYYNSHFPINNVSPYQPPPPYQNAMNNYYTMTKRPPMPKTVKKGYFRRWYEAFDEYCDTSTIHGLKYVGENRISPAERIFWLISVLVAGGMAIYFISNLYINYGANPVIVSFSPQMVNVNKIPFPAITICNLNVAQKKRALVINKSGTKAEKHILADLCDKNISSTDNDGAQEPISWTTMQDTILKTTQKCDEMIIGCKWQSEKRSCVELFNPVFTDDGYCCSFNKLPVTYALRDGTSEDIPGVSFPRNIFNWDPESGYPAHATEATYPYRAFGRGVNQGLTLVLDANIDEYFCSTTSSVGFKALFATPRDSPKMRDLGFLIAPGIETRVSIDLQIEDATDAIRGIDYRKRKCYFATERVLKFYKLYSARNCLLECEANYTLERCGCTTFDMPRVSYTKICDKSDEECVTQARFHIERFGADKSACNCLPGCFEIAYTPDVMTVGNLNDDAHIIDEHFLNRTTEEYFTKNMAIVHFFYSQDKFQKLTKTALYGFPEFLSNTGGLLGLFLGFSFLSAVEIFYFVFMRSGCKWGYNKIKNQRSRIQFTE